MILGFYYHIPCYVNPDGRIGMPAFQGLFIDSLARETEMVYCFLHQQEMDRSIDYWIVSQNVQLISLGPDAPAYIKTFLPHRFLNKDIQKCAAKCDKIIIRGPSPLLHHFRHFIPADKLVYFIIGSYNEGLKHTYGKWYRRYPIRLLLKYIDLMQTRALKRSTILVNNKATADRYSAIAEKTMLVYTTTLKSSDFFIRNDTCQSRTIKLMFIGRFDWAKGLRELIEAFQIIREKHLNTELHFVGWEYNSGTTIKDDIQNWVKDLGISEQVFFHGKKTAGPDLLAYYRQGDIYILPSYHEGFPKTIWEAMASSLPVITTTVGGIPDFLINKRNAYLISPHDRGALVNAILEIIEDKNLRIKLIEGGLERVKEVTLEEQARKIINYIS